MASRRLRRFAAGIVCLLYGVLCLWTSPALAAATPGDLSRPLRTVRVGLPDTDMPGVAGGDNRTVAFYREYLEAVAEYAGWRCVYVPANWARCLEMARTGEVDVMMDVTMTDERLAEYNFASESMGTEMCYLFGRGDTTWSYNDFTRFDGMTVGYEQGSTIIDSLRKYGERQGFSFTSRPYASGAAMFAALDAGEVDTVAQTSYFETPPGHVILAKCDPSPVYLVTAKQRPELAMELDEALSQLFSFNPGFNADLFSRHFGSVVSRAVGYTQEETAYLNSHPVVDVYYETSWEPFEYEEDGQAAGITPEVIRAIGKDTGIDFRFVLSSSTKDVYSGMGEASRDAVMAVSYDYRWAGDHDLLLTQPYISGSVMRVTREDASGAESVATVTQTYLEQQVRRQYPSLTVRQYDNYAGCMDAVARGEADCTYLNYYQASYYRSRTDYADFLYQPDANIRQNLSLGVTRGSNRALFGILSKSLQRLSADTVQGILNENATRTEPFTLKMMLRRHPVQTLLGVGLVGMLIAALTVLACTASARRRQYLRLADAMRQAEEANAAKSEFLSRMSHDMRTPLSGIMGMTRVARLEANPPATLDCLDKIDTSSRFLLSLIGDVLDMAKAESGKIELHPSPYSPEEFRQYLEAVIRPLCDEKKQRFTVNVELPAGCVPVGDKLRINQIVFNLLSNASKYTPEGGEIGCDVRGQAAQAGLNVSVRISDNGRGISEEFQKILFDPFTQENRCDNSDNRGSGLGLAITKRLAELMGGQVTVQSRIGEGSVFTVWLHLGCVPSGAATDAAQAAAAPAAALRGKCVLVCEDHPLNRQIAKALLEARSMTVEMAEDGRAGVEAFARSTSGHYDAVLMDIRMPVLNGYDATRAIRALERPDARTVPIIAMTADAFADDVKKCLDAGMNGHVAKPVDPETLYRALADAMTPAQAPR